ncbi:ABC transporter permease [Aureimonas fodinaquatilis]|uniref:ABC transporter permease n=1 Tax=Aureimonas fodinaquatilis TaxID=2565783 RepID=A0A5B0DT15_9HYPH|nr:ABC transporter permease [Aureimonas fodinaquatilis]KAA0968901.1 ABC transporter permease [Aureimonas fodinaquatilis]
MIAFLIRRIGTAILVVFTVSLLAFMLVRLAGDPAAAIAGEGATPADIERIRILYGFDKPWFHTYLLWLERIFNGDLGYSPITRQDVSAMIAKALPVTLTLGGMAMLFAMMLSLPLGIIASLKPNGLVDRIVLAITVVFQAMPVFWMGLLLLLYFGLYWRLFPTGGDATLKHFVLPAAALGLFASPGLIRLTRAGMLDALASDYVRTARAKGMSEMTIVLRHTIPNAMIPVVALAAVECGTLLGGSIVIEAVFSLNGLGQLAWRAIQRLDIAVIQGVVLVVAVIYILLTLFADFLNAFLDPRIRVK